MQANSRSLNAVLTSAKRFIIPEFQRPYCWTKEEITQLWSDLDGASRPYVSNDNPYSESQFKTLKYRPEFLERFGSVQESRRFCQVFFPWYNTEHHHSGIGFLTPEQVHQGMAQQVVKEREAVLKKAYQMHPDRFKRGLPKPMLVPDSVWINKPMIPSGSAHRRSPVDARGLKAVGAWQRVGPMVEARPSQ